MKIRNGFVSNSSSSSFIISNEHFPTVRSLARYMLNKKIDDYENDYGDKDIYDKKLIGKLKKIDENDPVSFSSCNYDTYIKKIADCYVVSTCNNTNWELYDYTTKLSEDALKELAEYKKKYGHSYYTEIDDIINGYYDFSSFGNDYYNLDNEIIGVETYDYCPNHKKEIHKDDYSPYLWETKQWGKICPKCNPVIKRKEKLENINKLSNNK